MIFSSSSNGWCAPTLSDADMYCTKEKLSISIISSRKWFFSLKKKKKWANITRAGHLNISINIYYVFSSNSFSGRKIYATTLSTYYSLEKKREREREELLPEKNTVKRYKEMNTPLDNTLGPSSYTKYTTKKILSLDIEIAVCFLFFSFSLRRVKTLRLECDELFDVRHDFAFYFSKGKKRRRM
jgi:hypothetical protein